MPAMLLRQDRGANEIFTFKNREVLGGSLLLMMVCSECQLQYLEPVRRRYCSRPRV